MPCQLHTATNDESSALLAMPDRSHPQARSFCGPANFASGTVRQVARKLRFEKCVRSIRLPAGKHHTPAGKGDMLFALAR
jgi:hypothetical protein